MNPTLLSLQDVAIGYPGNPVLRPVNLEIAIGESLAVLGSNGAGKTALLKTIAGILSPLDGVIRMNDSLNNHDIRIGYVPQRRSVSGLLPLTVREVVEMGTYGELRPWQSVREKERERIDWAMSEVGITDLDRKSYADLSGGQQQRVLIARALSANPTILIMDEPLASLDRETVRSMVTLLAKLKQDSALTLLWADHFLPTMSEVVEEVLLLEEGKLVRSQFKALLERDPWEMPIS